MFLRQVVIIAAGLFAGFFCPDVLASTVGTPYFSPGAGTFSTELYVTVDCNTPGAVIHYTTNGGEPAETDTVIASGGSVLVDHSLTLKAKAWKNGFSPSAARSASYVFQAGTPSFSPSTGSYYSEQNVVVTCVTPGATVHYTTNGADPTESDPVVASGGTVLVDQGLTLKAKAWRADFAPSGVAAASYTLVVATPVFSPDGGSFLADQNVTISCATPSTTIHYTTNGIDPTESDAVVTSGSSVIVSVCPQTVLKARAFRASWGSSGNMKTAVYKTPIIYVSTSGNDSYGGGTWASAKATLQGALDLAISGDEIWVAAGTYKPTSDYGLVASYGQVQARLKHFRMKNGVGIYGGFAGNETVRAQRDWRTNVTILTGDIDARTDANGIPDDSNNCYHVFYEPYSSNLLTATAVLDGFTITGGVSDANYPNDRGGGVYVTGTPSMCNCTFLRNQGTWAGGLYGNARAINCMFFGNAANEGAGACGSGTFQNCMFAGNVGDSLSITASDPAAVVEGCTIVADSNSSTAMYIDYPPCTTSYVTGGNNLIWGKVDYDWIGCPDSEGSSQGAFMEALSQTGDTESFFAQGAMLANASDANQSPVLNLGFIRNPSAGGDGLWGTADDDYGDLRLMAGSSGVDAGNNSLVTAATDMLGNPRIVDGNGDASSVVDLGAYERQCVTNPVGDVGYDCGVDFRDFAILTGHWNQSGCTSANSWCYGADIDQNGIVDIRDMAAIAAHWLEGM